MGLTKIKGQNFRVFTTDPESDSDSAVVEATSCQCTISGSMEDAKTKDSEGSYAQEQMATRGWTVQVDSLYATAAYLIGIIRQFNSDDKLDVGWDQTATTQGTMNRTAMNADFARSGEARLTDFTISAENRSNITVSRTFTGCGALS
jgi:hypothetical protein